MLPTIHFPPSVLEDLTKESTLVIETDDYTLEPSYRTMYLFKGESANVIYFNSTDVSAPIHADGGISVKEGKNDIRLKLAGYYKDLADKGFTLKGYGFAVQAVYLD